MAVICDPAEWSPDGQALTLEALGHYAAAGQAMNKLTMRDCTRIGRAAVLVVNEAKRRQSYLDDAVIGRALCRKHIGAPYSAEVPELVALKRTHGLTNEQLSEIRVESWGKKWGRPQAR